MLKNLLAKLAFVVTGAGMSLGIFASDSVMAASMTYNFRLKDTTGEFVLRGTFQGDDLNGNNQLSLDELEFFNVPVLWEDTSFSLADVLDFQYTLNTRNDLFIDASKQVDINDGNIESIEYFLLVFDTDSILASTTYFADGMVIVGDIFFEQPPTVTLQGTTTPEGGNILALTLTSLLLLLLPKKQHFISEDRI